MPRASSVKNYPIKGNIARTLSREPLGDRALTLYADLLLSRAPRQFPSLLTFPCLRYDSNGSKPNHGDFKADFNLEYRFVAAIRRSLSSTVLGEVHICPVHVRNATGPKAEQQQQFEVPSL